MGNADEVEEERQVLGNLTVNNTSEPTTVSEAQDRSLPCPLPCRASSTVAWGTPGSARLVPSW